MDKQNAILKTHELEVIGQGPMVKTPCQIGEWWVMPAEQYKGVIPPDIQQKWDNFKALNIPVLGYLIADDMRDVLVKRAKEAEEALERERKAEAELQRKYLEQQAEVKRQEAMRQAEIRRQQAEETAKQAAKVALAVVGGIVAVGAIAIGGAVALAIGAVSAAIRFCPILIAVLPDGRWICLGAWWD
jgi:hypothetical protein